MYNIRKMGKQAIVFLSPKISQITIYIHAQPKAYSETKVYIKKINLTMVATMLFE